MARISKQRIEELKKLLKEQTGKDYSDEEAQEAGLAITRFVAVKEIRNKEKAIKTKKKPAFPQNINGINFATKEEYDERVQSDTEQLANFLLKIYKQQKTFDDK